MKFNCELVTALLNVIFSTVTLIAVIYLVVISASYEKHIKYHHDKLNGVKCPWEAEQ